MFKKVKIKLTPTSKNEPEIYFDPEVFSLLADPVKGIENQVLKKIALALLPFHYNSLPYYISRIIRSEKGLYKIIVFDAKLSDKKIVAHVDVLSISLSSGTEVRSARSDQVSFPQEIDFKKLDLKVVDTAVVPENFNLDSALNQNNKEILQSYIDIFKKAKENQKAQFEKAESCTPFNVEDEPSPKELITADEYSFNKSAEIFPPLKPLATACHEMHELEDGFQNLLKKFNELLKETGKNNALLDYTLKTAKTLQLDSVSSMVNEKSTAIRDMVEGANVSFEKLFVNYVNRQEKIDYIKRCLAWGLHYAAGRYFNQLQRDTLNDPTNRKSKIDSFNNHFKNLVQANEEGLVQIHEDGSFSNLSLVYDKFTSLSLKEIADFLSRLLSKECNTTTWWSSDKQKELVNGINQITKILQGEPISTKPFEAWIKSYLGLGKAGFAWDKSMLHEEAQLEKEAMLVQSTLESDPRFHALKEIDLKPVKSELKELEEQFALFEKRVAQHQELLDLKKEAQLAIDKINALNRVESFTQAHERILSDLKQILSLTNKPNSVQIKIKSSTLTEENLPAYLLHLVKAIESRTNDTNDIGNKILGIEELNAEAPVRHLQILKRRVEGLNAACNEAKMYRDELDDITRQLNVCHVDAVRQNKIDQLTQFKQDLKETLRLIDSQYRLPKVGKFSGHEDIKPLTDTYKESKQIIDQLVKNYEKKTISDDNLLDGLEKAKQTLSTHFKNIENCVKSIDEKLLNLKKKSTPPITKEADILPLDVEPIRLSARHFGSEKRAMPPDSPPPAHQNDVVILMPQDANEPEGFFKRHWRKMLAGGLFFAGLTVIGVFTGGAVPTIVGLIGSGPLLAGLVTSATGVVGGAVGVSVGAGVGALTGEQPKEGGVLGFFKRHWKKILIGAGVGLGIAGITAITVVTFGVGGAAFGAIGAATAASAGAFGSTLSGTTAGILGTTLITTGSTLLGTLFGGFASAIADGFHFRRGRANANVGNSTPPAPPEDRDDTNEDDFGPSPAPKMKRFNNKTITKALSEEEIKKRKEVDQLQETLALMKEFEADLQNTVESSEERDRNNIIDFGTTGEKGFSGSAHSLYSEQKKKSIAESKNDTNSFKRRSFTSQ